MGRRQLRALISSYATSRVNYARAVDQHRLQASRSEFLAIRLHAISPANFVDRRIYERDGAGGTLKKRRGGYGKGGRMGQRGGSQPRRRSRRRYLLLGPMSVI